MNGRGRLLSIAAAGLLGWGLPALAQTLDDLKPTLNDGEQAAAPAVDPPQPRIPQLEVTPEDEPLGEPLEVNPPEEPLAEPRRRPREVVVEPFESRGLGSSVFRIYPTLGVDAVYSTNPTNSPSDPEDAFGLRIRPSLRFESDWSRHSWTADARGSFLDFEGDGESAILDANASTRFRLDILRTTRAEFEARYSLEEQDDDEFTAETGYDQNFGASAALTHDFGQFDGRLRGGANVQLFDDLQLLDGTKEDNGDREYVEPTVSIRATYTDPPAFKPFVEVGYAPRFYFESKDRNGENRNSHGFNARAGLVIDRGPIWSGEAALVYSLRDYEDSALKTTGILGVDANLTWRPTELTEVTVTASTALDDVTEAGASATQTWTFGADAAQAVKENVDVFGGAEVTLEDTSIGTDVTVDTTMGVAWRLNPWVTWSASYDATWFEGVGSDGDYREHRIITGIELRP